MFNLCLVGNATTPTTTDGTVLRLTSSAPCCQAGSTWYATKQNITNGFQTIFKYRLTYPDITRADGFAFVIQSQSATVIGGAGCDVGYGGIPYSLAIEFDTFKNPSFCEDTNDPNNNHIAIHSKGPSANSRIHQSSAPWVAPAPDSYPDWNILENGVDIADKAVHEVRIIYAPKLNSSGLQGTGVIRVFVDDFPVLSKSVDIAQILANGNGQAWVGFTAATGTTMENHDIISWNFMTALQVTNNQDNTVSPPSGSLRQVINTAQSGSLITFASGLTSINLNGVITINQDTTIDAGGLQLIKTKGPSGVDEAEHFGLTISCNNCSQIDMRAFYINPNKKAYIGGMVFRFFSPRAGGAVISSQGTLVLTHIIMESNRANRISADTGGQGSGGAVYSNSSSTLVIDTSVLRNNIADCDGGAIYISGILRVKSSSFYGNKANQNQSACQPSMRGGGAIVDFASGDENIKIYSSLFDANTSRQGGAIYTNGSTGSHPRINNSTFTKNVATDLGGAAIYAGTGGNEPILVNVTIAKNRVKQGITQQGSLWANAISVQNTIVADSGLVDANGNVISGSSPNCFGNLTGIDQGFNLSTDNTCKSIPVGNPDLAPDIDVNGGVTRTLALQGGGQAINGANQLICASLWLYDQRGPNYLRIKGTSCDMGAFEY